MRDAFQWLSPWYPVDSIDVRAGLEAQLRREVGKRHALYGRSVRLIARRDDTDDALFALEGGGVAEVHMTWKNGAEEKVIFASTDIPFVGDVNGDGKADVIVFAQGEGKVYVSIAP